uniref:Small proline-rich protein 5 n=1 Tax=Camelus bactrianus TaxID=9837 RepID=A0A9W3G439_CAMBA|nr:putative small proline-rich protein 5 [Camelus bactrianus]
MYKRWAGSERSKPLGISTLQPLVNLVHTQPRMSQQKQKQCAPPQQCCPPPQLCCPPPQQTKQACQPPPKCKEPCAPKCQPKCPPPQQCQKSKQK